MEKTIKTLEICKEVFSMDIYKNLKLSNVQKINLIRTIFKSINNELDVVNEGKLKVQGLGNFIVRNVIVAGETDTVRRIVFKGSQ